MRQTVDAQRHGGGGGNRADADLPVIPKPDAQRGRAGGQRAVDDEAAGVQKRCQTHLGVYRNHKFFHRLLGVGRFARAVGEEFDGGDVGIGVSNAAGHQRARIRLTRGGFAELGNQETHNQGESNHPADKGQQQPAVERNQNHAGRDEIHQHIHDHVGNRHHHVAQRQRGLHDFGGHASCKFVLIEAQALSQHQAMEVPA